MLLAVFAALLTLAVAWALTRPLLRAQTAPAAPGAFNAAVYRDQLDEIDRDVARGVLAESDAAAARIEVERRLLSAARIPAAAAPGAESAAPRRAAVIVGAAVAIAAGGVYLALGSPGQPDRPLAARVDQGTAIAGGDAMHGQMADLVRQLEEKMKERPDDPTGWALLARSLARLDRTDEALAAYERAIALTRGEDGALQAEYAETRIAANDGVVDAEAERIFTRMLQEEPGAPQARYYLALAKSQRGDVAAALADWRALLADSPAEAPWRPALEARIAEASGARPAAPGPTREQAEAAQQMAPEERNAMVAQMVSGLAERLKSQPDDLDGWRRLARAYDVLGRTDEAVAAHRNVLRLAPNDPAALWALGGYAKARGDSAEARRRWQALERTLPADAPERARVREALAGL